MPPPTLLELWVPSYFKTTSCRYSTRCIRHWGLVEAPPWRWPAAAQAMQRRNCGRRLVTGCWRESPVPGASQHQIGTTIDINSLDISFAKTKEGKWLNDNAYKYGFIMSYPEGQEDLTGYRFEPWHYRYIGKDASVLVYKYFDNLLELFLNWYWDFKVEK